MKKRLVGLFMIAMMVISAASIGVFADTGNGVADGAHAGVEGVGASDAQDAAGSDSGDVQGADGLEAAGVDAGEVQLEADGAEVAPEDAAGAVVADADVAEADADGTGVSDEAQSEVLDDVSVSEPVEAKLATSVSPSGGKGSGTLNDTNKNAEFTVKLEKAGRLTIDLTTGVKVNMDLYYGTRNEHKDNNVVDAGSQSFVYDLKPGTYTLYFERFLGRESGTFSFTTSFVAANETYTQDNDTVNAVRAGSAVPFGKTINGQIAWNDKYDYYKIVLKSAGRLKTAVHSNVEKISVVLYDADNSYVFSESSMSKGDESHTVDLVAGTYYLKFERYLKSNTGTYNFKLTFTSAGETYTAENNTINAVRAGSSVPLGKTVTGQLAYNDQYDYYKIKVPGKARYTLTFKSNIPKIEFYLYNSSESNVNDVNGNSYHIHEKGTKTYTYVLTGGTYYLQCARYLREDTGTYTFRVNVSSPKTAISSLKKGKKCFTVKWTKKTEITGYQIQYSLKKTFKSAKTVTVKKPSATSKKIKKLKKKTKYYVRIRTYKTIGGKTYYSGWSKYKAVKTK